MTRIKILKSVFIRVYPCPIFRVGIGEIAMPEFHLAQINIARMLGPRDSPTMAEFMARLDEINALADVAPGFVWRLQDENGNATDIRAFDDDWLIVNMSVW